MIRGITICVNYDDYLSATIDRNLSHLDELVIVTSLQDEKTAALASGRPNVRVHRTDAFTRHGATFNKGLAMEEGFDVLGRHGWILIFDADIALPNVMDLSSCKDGHIYGARRRMMPRLRDYISNRPWTMYPIGKDIEIAGFFQLFNADDPVIANRRPWYDPTFVHAGGGDAYFQQLWPKHRRVRLPLEVLHIGPRDENWYGRVTPRADGAPVEDAAERKQKMEALQISQGWKRAKGKRIAVKDRVAIPGFESDYLWGMSNPKTDVIKGTGNDLSGES